MRQAARAAEFAFARPSCGPMIPPNSLPMPSVSRSHRRRFSLGGQSFSSDFHRIRGFLGALAPEAPESVAGSLERGTSGPKGPLDAAGKSDLKVRPPKRTRFRPTLGGQIFSSAIRRSCKSSGALAPEILLLKGRPTERNDSARRRIPPISPHRLHHAR